MCVCVCWRLWDFNFDCVLSPFEEETAMESENVLESMETPFTLDQTTEGKFLSLDDLGKVLTHLASLGMAFMNLTIEKTLYII